MKASTRGGVLAFDMSALMTAMGVLGPRGLISGDAVAVARVARNMQHAEFTDEEIVRWIKALYLTGTQRDVREAWAVIDRRRTGTIPRVEVEDALVDIFGDDYRRSIASLLSKLPSAAGASALKDRQMIEATEFSSIVDQLAHLSRGVSFTGFMAEEARGWFSEATRGVTDASRAWTSLDLDVLAMLPPPLLPRAGAVVQRFLKAGYSSHDASTAVAALFGPRDARSVARLWGLFDLDRTGVVPGSTFDAAIGLLTDAITPADVPTMRAQMGFVEADSVTFNEFEAALRLLIPADGSPPRLGADDHEISLPELLGGQPNVQRLKPFQRQRALRLAHRMKNFGYPETSISLLCRTLFLTKLHDRDLWNVWIMFHPSEASKAEQQQQQQQQQYPQGVRAWHRYLAGHCSPHHLLPPL